MDLVMVMQYLDKVPFNKTCFLKITCSPYYITQSQRVNTLTINSFNWEVCLTLQLIELQ